MIAKSESIDFSLSGIYKSWYAFRAGKQSSRSIIAFEYNLENNLVELTNDLQNNRYRHGGYSYRVVSDSKTRRIAIAPVRDRVVHRCLYDYMVPLMDKQFDYDVWSCRVGKGLQGAIRRTQRLLQRYPSAWVWRGDIAKFFDSVPHANLLGIAQRSIHDAKALHVLDKVIKSYETKPGVGIAIGNLTSQILANTYLNEFDRFVRYTLKPLGYLRYGDDFILLTPSQHQARELQQQGIIFLDEQLGLKIHRFNNHVLPVHFGLHFLGSHLYSSGGAIQPRTWHRLEQRLSPKTHASYHGLVHTFGSPKQRRHFEWLYEPEQT